MAHLKTSLSEADLEKAKKELSEDPETRRIEINTLKERLLKIKGLNPRVDDAFLLKFLRGRKFDQERTFELIMNYYKMKKDNEDIFATTSPLHVRHVLDAEMMCPLPGKSKNGETVFVFRTENWDPSRHPMDDIFRTNFIINSFVTDDEGTQVNGIRYISDLKGLTWNHATQMTPAMAQRMANMAQDAFPMRIKGVHYVNEPSVFDYVFAILKPFLNEKLKSRINFHGEKYEELHNFIDKEHLPEQYGGLLQGFKVKEFNQSLYEKQSEFEAEAKFGYVDMTLKGKTKKSADAVENLPGTFKKLNVD